jgi:hypothetical protein
VRNIESTSTNLYFQLLEVKSLTGKGQPVCLRHARFRRVRTSFCFEATIIRSILCDDCFSENEIKFHTKSKLNAVKRFFLYLV